MADGRIVGYGHTIAACALGQASSSIMARHVVGSAPAELRELRETVRKTLDNHRHEAEHRRGGQKRVVGLHHDVDAQPALAPDENPRSVVAAIALSREVHEFWLPLGDVPVGRADARR